MAVIIRPIVTEKMTNVTEKSAEPRKKKVGSAPVNRVYGFYVDPDANKCQIKAAVEKKFNVKVVAVNTANFLGKTKSRYTKKGLIVGKSSDFKKAFVTLAEGQEIDFYSNIN